MLTTLLTLQAAAQAAAQDAAPAETAGQAATIDPTTDPIGALQALKVWAVDFAPNLVGALLTLIVGMWVAKTLTRGVRSLMEKRNLEISLAQFLGSLVYYTLVAMVLMAVVGKLGVETTSFVAIFGAVAFAIGFALQGSLGNIAAGVMILLFRPFKVGDVIDAGGSVGAVKEIGIFATIMTTPDNKKIIVPNSTVTGGTITNVTAYDTRRVDMVFGIGYGDDIGKARQVIQSILDADERVLKDPAPLVAVSELADSSVNFNVRPWCKTGDYWGVFFDTHEKVKLAMDRENISIPFPQRDIHVYQQAGAASA